MSNPSFLTQWSLQGDLYGATPDTIDCLPPAAYKIVYTQQGPKLRIMDIISDSLATLPVGESGRITETLDTFWKSKDKFQEFGFLWKRGVLMYGPPGCGKTSIIIQVVRNHIENGGIALFVGDADDAKDVLPQVRQVEPDRPIICIMEDLDSIIDRCGESDILSLLDGETQVDKVVYLATTNYIDKLPPRLTRRPSRFDMLVNVSLPSPALRVAFLQAIGKGFLTPAAAEEWARATEGFSFAHLKELVISVFLFEVPFDEAIESLKKMGEGNFHDDEESNDVQPKFRSAGSISTKR